MKRTMKPIVEKRLKLYTEAVRVLQNLDDARLAQAVGGIYLTMVPPPGSGSAHCRSE